MSNTDLIFGGSGSNWINFGKDWVNVSEEGFRNYGSALSFAGFLGFICLGLLGLLLGYLSPDEYTSSGKSVQQMLYMIGGGATIVGLGGCLSKTIRVIVTWLIIIAFVIGFIWVIMWFKNN